MSWLRSLWDFCRPRTIGIGYIDGQMRPVYRCDNPLRPILGGAVMHCQKPIRHEGPHRQGETTWWPSDNEPSTDTTTGDET